MSEIDVYLSTSKWMCDSTNDSRTQILSEANIPVCTATIMIITYGFSPSELEKAENDWAKICEKMAKYVKIDSKKKTIYIGETPEYSSESALIEFNGTMGKYTEEFYHRWDITQTLILEYTVLDNDRKPVLCLKGLWSYDHWHGLEIVPSNNITVIPPLDE